MSDSIFSRELRDEMAEALDGIAFAIFAATAVVENFPPAVAVPAPVDWPSQASASRALYRRLQGR